MKQLNLVISVALAQTCFQESTWLLNQPPGFKMSNIDDLTRANVTADWSVRGIKLCADSLNNFQGVQIQISKSANRLVLPLSPIGYMICTVQKITSGNITQVAIAYSQSYGVS
jgi:hypothetical protein